MSKRVILDKQEFIVNSTQKSLTIDQLDRLMQWSLDPKSGKFSAIIHCIKIFAVFAYVYTRKQLVDESWHISVQRSNLESIEKNRRAVEEEL